MSMQLHKTRFSVSNWWSFCLFQKLGEQCPLVVVTVWRVYFKCVYHFARPVLTCNHLNFVFLGNCLHSFQPGHPERTNTQPEHPGAKGNFERGERLGLVILLEKKSKRTFSNLLDMMLLQLPKVSVGARKG